MQGASAHALTFSWACWSGIWPGMDARRRLAVAKGLGEVYGFPQNTNVFL